MPVVRPQGLIENQYSEMPTQEMIMASDMQFLDKTRGGGALKAPMNPGY